MSELHDAAQDLVDYYDGLAKKYGRIAEYKAVKTRMDRVRKALEEEKAEDCSICHDKKKFPVGFAPTADGGQKVVWKDCPRCVPGEEKS